MIHYRGADVLAALGALAKEKGDPYEGVTLAFVNPVTGAPVFPTLAYGAQLLRPGEETRWKRETASTFYVCMEGSGFTEIAGQRYDWQKNDMVVAPNFLWRRHVNTGTGDAVLYSVSEAPLMEKIGQYRAQGRLADGSVTELIA
jgi:gentisate 1,2-dioxygenase